LTGYFEAVNTSTVRVNDRATIISNKVTTCCFK